MEYLHLPTWSPGFVKPSDPECEVTPRQIISAYKVIREYEDFIEEMNKDDEIKCHSLIEFRSGLGIANRMHSVSSAYMMALFLRKKLVSSTVATPSLDGTKSFEAFEYPPNLLELNNSYGNCNRNKISPSRDFILKKRPKLKKKSDMYVMPFTLTFYPLFHDEYGDFIYKHFGIHFHYFICNYLCRIPNDILKIAKNFMKPVPKHLLLFGLQIRYHKDSHFYMENMSSALEVIIPFLHQEFQKKPTIFFLASDSAEIIQLISKEFGKEDVLTYEAIRVADADHFSAMIDFTCLMFARELLLTQFSTFSHGIAARLGRPAYYYQRDLPGIIRFSNSQVGNFGILYYNQIKGTIYGLLTNSQTKLTETNARSFHNYYRLMFY